MLIYAIILIWSMTFFGAVHTYAYTFMNISIVIAFCRYCIHWEKKSIILPNLEINYLLIIFSGILLLYIVPLPQYLIQVLSTESARMNQLSQSPMEIVHQTPIRWGTLAVSNNPVYHVWVQYMAYVLFFWGILVMLNKDHALKKLCLLLIGMGTIESLYGLSQTFIDTGYILWVPKALFKNKHDTCGTFINRNHFATLMTMLMLFSVAYSASQTSREKSTKRYQSFKRKLARFLTYEYQWNQKLIGIAAASIMGLGVYYSSSRGAVIAALPGALLLILALTIRKSTRKQGIIMILVVFILVCSTVSIGEDRLIHRFNAIQRAMVSRIRYVDSTIDLIKDYTVFGVGPGNFTHAFPRYQSAKDQQITVTHVHNDWLQFYSEMGILGFSCLVMVLFFFIKRMLQKFFIRESPSAISLGAAPIAVLTALSVHSLFDFPLHIPANMLILISICAAGLHALHIVHHQKRPSNILEYKEIPFTLRHSYIWIALYMCLLSMIFISTSHFIAESYCNTVPNSTLNRNQNPEIDAIQKAIAWDSDNPVHWYKLAWQYIAYRNTFSETDQFNQWRLIQHKILNALEQTVANNPCEAEYHIRLAWEYHRLQHHESGDLKRKRNEASDIAMKHAAIVCGDKSYSQHMEIANYWNMRSAVVTNHEKQETFWKLASAHYRKALRLSPRQRCKKAIVKQLELFRRNEEQFQDIFNE